MKGKLLSVGISLFLLFASAVGCANRTKEGDGSMVKITQNNFTSEILNSEQPALLDFWASWCAP